MTSHLLYNQNTKEETEMERIIYTLTLDAHKSGIQKTLQGFETSDNMSRRIAVGIMSRGESYEIPNGTVAVAYVTTPNATEPSINDCLIEDNMIIYDVLPIVEDGITEVQFKLIDGSVNGASKVLMSPKIALEVSESDADDGNATQTTTFTALENALIRAKALYDERLVSITIEKDCTFRVNYADGTTYENDALKEAIYNGNALLSETYAKGETGVRVGEDTDNSKYYSNVSRSAAIDSLNVSEDAMELLEEAKKQANFTSFAVNFKTGELGYLSNSYTFDIDENGDLDVVGNGAVDIEGLVGELVIEFIDDKSNAIDKQLDDNTNAIEGLNESVASMSVSKAEDNVVTTEKTLVNSKEGGLLVKSISGASVQNGTPTPSTPIAILNAFDCVEMIQGYYDGTTGNYGSSNAYLCTKNKVPCGGGESITITLGQIATFRTVYFDEGMNYISTNTLDKSSNKSTYTDTTPTNAKYFVFHIYTGENNITPSTVGKIELAINGKYVALVKTVGKNLLDCRGLATTTSDGVTFTPAYDSNGNLECITLSGTSTNIGALLVGEFTMKKGEKYILNGCQSGGSANTYRLDVRKSASILYNEHAPYYDYGTGVEFTAYEDVTVSIGLRYASGNTFNNVKFYPMVRLASVEDATYEPYKESNAYIRLSDSLRGIGDVKDEIVRKNSVWGVQRRFAEVTLNGSEYWNSNGTSTSGVYRFYTNSLQIKPPSDSKIVANVLCDRYPRISATDTWNKMNGIAVSPSGPLYIYYDGINDNDVSVWKDELEERPLTVTYEMATPTFEELDADSQIALNSLETFNGVTTIKFDSRVQPGIEVEYGKTTQGAYSIKALHMAEQNKRDIDALGEEIVRVDAKADALEKKMDAIDTKHINTSNNLAEGLVALNERVGGLENDALTNAKVVNNTTTTEEGYVLDARVGKALQDKVNVVSLGGDGLSEAYVVGNRLTIELYGITAPSFRELWISLVANYPPVSAKGYRPLFARDSSGHYLAEFHYQGTMHGLKVMKTYGDGAYINHITSDSFTLYGEISYLYE